MKFGYWGLRGAGQVSRLLLAFTGAEWEDVKYTSREQWFETDKPTINMPFPNLPYLIDGDFALSESSAIPRYIISKSDKKDLLGKNLQDQARVNEILGLFEDVRKPIAPLFWDKEWETKKDEAFKKIQPKLESLSKFVGEKDTVLGYLTILDFQIAEFSHYIEKLYPEEYAKLGFLKRIRDSFNNVPEIKAYYEKETAVKGPFVPEGMGSIPF